MNIQTASSVLFANDVWVTGLTNCGVLVCFPSNLRDARVTSRSVGRSVGQSVSRSVGQSVSRSVGRSVGRSKMTSRNGKMF
jgi:hypothetical protein